MKPILNCPRYFISREGKVYSKLRGKLRTRRLRVNRHGRVFVRLRGKRYSISRLVAKAFVPNPLGMPMALHKDNNPGNNYFTNIFWGNQQINMAQKVREGRCNQPSVYNSLNDLERCIRIIKSRQQGKKLKWIAEVFDITIASVSNIIKGKTGNAKLALEKLNKSVPK